MRTSRRNLLLGSGAVLALAACGAPLAGPSPTPTSAAPALAATAAAMGRGAVVVAAGTPQAGGVPAPTATPAPPTPTLIPPRPTVTPTPKPILPTPTPAPMPTGLEIPKIGVNAIIKGIGVKANGALGEPDAPFDVGWFKDGPRPGDPGNAILTGHLDSAGSPPFPAVFWRLKELAPGDDVIVRTARGPLTFKVESSALYDRHQAPVEQILGWAMGKVITIVTCEGTFISGERDYTHRRVVRARLS